MTRRTRARYRLVDECKKQPCEICGQRFPPCVMDFHHPNDDKVKSIGEMQRDRAPMSEVYAEISKCILVCSNCHRIIHYAEEE